MTDDPLRIGVLGAARISGDAIGRAAAESGHRLVAIAARDRSRAQEFAAEHGVERVLDGYDDVLADAEVEVVYDPLPNGLHGGWNLRALAAGQHVLTEKPSVSHADEAREVRAAAAVAGRRVVEAFHYVHHPLVRRLRDVVIDGTLGEVRTVEVSMRMPPPAADDVRWSFDLAGGALMDVGCYGVHVLRTLAADLGGTADLVSASANPGEADPRVDAHVEAELALPGGVQGVLTTGMDHHETDFSLTVTGTAGSARVPAFVLPHLGDDRLILRVGDEERTEHHGDGRSTYAYQLDALHALLRDGTALVTDEDDAVAQAETIDAIYTAAGLPLRPVTPIG